MVTVVDRKIEEVSAAGIVNNVSTGRTLTYTDERKRKTFKVYRLLITQEGGEDAVLDFPPLNHNQRKRVIGKEVLYTSVHTSKKETPDSDLKGPEESWRYELEILDGRRPVVIRKSFP